MKAIRGFVGTYYEIKLMNLSTLRSYKANLFIRN